MNQKRFIKELINTVNKHKPTPQQLRYAFKKTRETTQLVIPTRQQRAPKYLTPPEIYLFMKAADEISTEHSILAHLLITTGLRIAEIKKLDLRDFNPTDNTIQIREGKGGKDRVVPLSDSLWRQIKAHIKTRDKGPLFVNSQLQPKTIRTLQRWTTHIGIKAGLEKRIHPHILRHTFATIMINKGFSLEQVQAILGHSSRVTTEIYAKVTIPLEVKEKYLQLMNGL